LATLAMLTFGGFCFQEQSGCINQIIERDFDKLMTRTMNRPLPTAEFRLMKQSSFQ